MYSVAVIQHMECRLLGSYCLEACSIAWDVTGDFPYRGTVLGRLKDLPLAGDALVFEMLHNDTRDGIEILRGEGQDGGARSRQAYAQQTLV